MNPIQRIDLLKEYKRKNNNNLTHGLREYAILYSIVYVIGCLPFVTNILYCPEVEKV